MGSEEETLYRGRVMPSVRSLRRQKERTLKKEREKEKRERLLRDPSI